MIAETTWNLGGWNSSDIFSNVMYEKERGTTVISNPSDGITRTTTWIGKIAVPYPSDYGYAADLSSCQETTGLYDNSTCTSTNWMYHIITNSGSKAGILLTPYSASNSQVFIANLNGSLQVSFVFGAGVVVPVLYLNSNQIIIGGDGSQNNPYQLKA